MEETTRASWEQVVRNVRSCLLSWGGRPLHTLEQRRVALQAFAWSKAWYVAQVLRPPARQLAELRKSAGTFLWMGRMERVAMAELESSRGVGGLELQQLETRCRGLAMAHMLRVWSAEQGRAAEHVRYWIGTLRADIRGPRAEVPTPYFRWVAGLIEEAETRSFTAVTPTREICKELRKEPDRPKVWGKPGAWGVAFSRIWRPGLSQGQQDLMWGILHDIYPTPERLHRLGQRGDGLCECGIQGSVSHIFGECRRVQKYWDHVRRKYSGFLPRNQAGSRMVLLAHPKTRVEPATTSLIGSMVEFIHKLRCGNVGRNPANLDSCIREAAEGQARAWPRVRQQLHALARATRT